MNDEVLVNYQSVAGQKLKEKKIIKIKLDVEHVGIQDSVMGSPFNMIWKAIH